MGIRIYTRTGDGGTTRIRGGERVPKTDQRIEANGALDELNSILGIVRSLSDNAWIQDILAGIQTNLMIVMSRVATRSDMLDSNPRKLPEGLLESVEKELDEITARGSVTQDFVIPGGNPAGAFLHQARAVCRRAERELWRLASEDRVEPEVMSYINRLSDLLFAMAREENSRLGHAEEIWNPFSGKADDNN